MTLFDIECRMAKARTMANEDVSKRLIHLSMVLLIAAVIGIILMRVEAMPILLSLAIVLGGGISSSIIMMYWAEKASMINLGKALLLLDEIERQRSANDMAKPYSQTTSIHHAGEAGSAPTPQLGISSRNSPSPPAPLEDE
jgi:hypothetical protein